jgi:excisionase family DNA binding protein
VNKPKREAEIQLLTINEVARREQVSPRTVRRQIESGDLPHFRIGRVIRISLEDLATFLARAKR